MRSVGVISVALPFLLVSSNAFAQSAVGTLANAAAGRSIADAVEQNQNDLIDREVRGGVASGGAAVGVGAFTSGRLRTSDHDGFDKEFDTTAPQKTFSYETDEASVFVNVSTALPGTVLGGQIKLSGFVGHNWLSLDLKSNSVSVLDTFQSGSAENDTVIAGGSVLWATQGGTYVLGTIVGSWGETKLTDRVDDCFDGGCDTRRYKFNTTGFTGSLTAGQVFDLAGTSGPKIDLRGSVGYTQSDGSSFINVHGDEQEYVFSTWTGTGSITLFSNIVLANDAVLRPYVQAYVRQEWGYRNEFEAIEFQSFDFLGRFGHDQSHTYGGVDGGLTYAFENMTLRSAVYYEESADERTLGGRIGASWTLDDASGSSLSDAGPFRWAGFYAGAHAGYAWGDSDARGNTTCSRYDPVDLPPPGPGYFCSRQDQAVGPPVADFPERAEAVSRTGSGPLEPDGFTGGVQVGRNWETGNLIVGVEFDVGAFDLRGSRSATAPTPGLNVTHTVSSSLDTDWLITARGRLGWAVSNTLVYATAGLAVTEVDVSASYRDTQLPPPGGAMNASNSDVKAGLAVGGGLEWAVNRHWTVKGEYLYVDFGSVTASGAVGHPGMAGLLSPYSVSTDLATHTARFGINHKF